jgi:hypothetical protein
MRGKDLTPEEIIQISKRIVRLYKEKNVLPYVKTNFISINNKNIKDKIYLSKYISHVFIELIYDVFYNYYVKYKFGHVDNLFDALPAISASFVFIVFADDFINSTDSENIKKELVQNIKTEFAYLHGKTNCNFKEHIKNDEFIKNNDIIKILKEIEIKYNIPEYDKILI